MINEAVVDAQQRRHLSRLKAAYWLCFETFARCSICFSAFLLLASQNRAFIAYSPEEPIHCGGSVVYDVRL